MDKKKFIYFKSGFIKPKKNHMNIYYKSCMKIPKNSSFFGRVKWSLNKHILEIHLKKFFHLFYTLFIHKNVSQTQRLEK